MPPAAATAAGRARTSRPATAAGGGTVPPRRRSAGRSLDEFRVTDRRSKRGTTAAAAAAPAAPRPSRKRREVQITPSSQTSAFDRVLGGDQRRATRGPGAARPSAPQPLMMAPRRRMPRMETGIFTVPSAMTGAIALPHPHITRPALPRPALRRPQVRRPALPRPQLSRASASLQLDRLIRSRLWIAVLGVMLVGIVGMRVEVLKLGTRTGSALQTASTLQAENALLQAKEARLDNPARISRIAAHDGMMSPTPTSSKFLNANAPGAVGTAIRALERDATQASADTADTADSGSGGAADSADPGATVLGTASTDQ